jgi:hypothetical protein
LARGPDAGGLGRCVAVPPGVARQDEAGRLWDVLLLLALATRRGGGAEVYFAVHVRNDDREGTPSLVRLKEGGQRPGDHATSCIDSEPTLDLP